MKTKKQKPLWHISVATTLEAEEAVGEKLAAIPSQMGVTAFVIATPRQGRGRLVTLTEGTLQAYRFE